jgi:uncharacterized protein with HEPN domain
MNNRVNKYLFDMKTAMESINEFVTDVDFDGFRASKLIRSAVERQLEIVGESVKRIERTGEIVPIENAKQIIAFRNILAHEYDRLEEEIVWMIVKKDVPQLLGEVNRLLENKPQ